MKIVYLGYDLFADALQQLSSIKGVEIMTIYSFKTDDIFEFNEKVKRIAESRNIPFVLGKLTKESAKKHIADGCDLFISAGYIYKIPTEIAGFRGVNFHPALLPVGRGAWPYPSTILRGLTESGVTVHRLAARLDEGDILLQQKYPVAPDETLDSLTEKSQKAAAAMVQPLINNFEQLWQNATPQDEGEYWQEPTDADRTVTPEMTVEKAKTIVRAFGSYGVIYGDRVYNGSGEKTEVHLANGIINLY